MTIRKWNLPLTYEPKIQPVIDGKCTQTIRPLIDHPCKCKGGDLGLWKHGESKHHSSGSKKICPKCNGTGIIPARPKKIDDLIRFYKWTGRPYWSKPVPITEYMEITRAYQCRIYPTGIRIPDQIHIKELGICGTLHWIFLDDIAEKDGIVPATGEALRDVLMSKNKIPKEGMEAQILRWCP